MISFEKWNNFEKKKISKKLGKFGKKNWLFFFFVLQTFVFAAIVAVAFGAPQKLHKNTDDVVLVKELLHDNIGLDNYQYNFQLSDGQQREEAAHLINPGTEHAAIVVRGSYSWVDPATNQLYTVTYVADEHGFHPEGAHIPSV